MTLSRQRLPVSCTTRPSRSSTRRRVAAATSGSWVMTTMVVPSAFSSLEQGEQAGAGGGVQVAGGLVGQHDRGTADQRRGRWPPAGVPRRTAARPVVRAVGQPDPVQRGRGGSAPLGGGYPAVEQPGRDVVERGEVLQEEELLEHHAQPVGPQRRTAAGRAGPRSAWPVMRTDPDVGRSSPAARLSRVVLPDPDGPTTATSSPTVDGEGDSARPIRPAGCPGRPCAPPTSSSTGVMARAPALAGPRLAPRSPRPCRCCCRTGPAAPARAPPRPAAPGSRRRGAGSSATTGTRSTFWWVAVVIASCAGA